ncbi:probable glutathione S-transferase [Rhodamnia argentea]|uniref:glutathione transferase n=1 Tax=Rhodamnia argentea TaxID=178133 RepID=A0A8B8MYB4_9MYRT|nr:probable glutathione S-transferase [Rhodamnia argentea]
MGGEEEVKLLGAWGSPFSWRVEAALKMKGVEYEYIDEDLMNCPKSSLLLQHNPVSKKIPVLVHDGKPIAESLVILEYIDEAWNDRPVILLPRDPHDRAVARFWAKFMDEKCAPALWRSCRRVGMERENAFGEACALLSVLEAELKDKQKRFFGGDTVGFVDIAGNFIGYWIGVIQEVAGVRLLTPDKFPVLCKWSEDFQNSPIIRENLPPREQLFAFFKARFERKRKTLSPAATRL